MNSTKEILELLDTPVNVKRLIDSLAFDLDNFEQANLQQPKLYLEAGRFLTWAVLEKARAEVKLETSEAELYVDLKSRTLEKQTDKAVTAKVASSPQIVKGKQKLYLAKASEIYAKQLVEAFNHRLQVINNITKIRTAEYSSNLRAAKEKVVVDAVRQEAIKMRQRLDNV